VFYLPQWFQTLFLYSHRIDLSARVMDMFLIRRIEGLFRIGLAIIQLSEGMWVVRRDTMRAMRVCLTATTWCRTPAVAAAGRCRRPLARSRQTFATERGHHQHGSVYGCAPIRCRRAARRGTLGCKPIPVRRQPLGTMLDKLMQLLLRCKY
jgi:hypothetical protein